MRTQLHQDTQILASLDPNSPTYARLQRRIERQTEALLDYENDRAQREHIAAARLAAERAASEQAGERATAAFMAVCGGGLIYTTWFSWWFLLGVVLLVGGLVTLFAKDL